MAQLQLANPIVFFDLETTGIDASKDRIVEIACIKINPNGVRDTFIKRINPQISIPAEVTAIHGISDEDVKNEPTFKMIARQLYDWMKGCDLGGYNAQKFDLPLLVEEFLRCQIEVDFADRKMIDVQQIFFKMEQRTLAAAYQFYCDKTLSQAHQAQADVEATIEVLEAQLDRYASLSNNVAALHEFCGGDDSVDFARRLIKKDGEVIFNFGKFKGMKVTDVLKREPQYYDWMMQGDFPLHTKQKMTEIYTQMKLGKRKA